MARTLNAAGVPLWEDGFVWMARLSGQDKLIKAGGYQAIQGDSPWRLLERLARGDMTQRQITFVEGLPMAVTGEILKSELKRRAIAGT